MKKRKKKKKGFTLIELLAVILILGIIALIAIPTVNSVIEQSRKGAFESTVNNLIKAAETKCSMELLGHNGITRTYVIKDGVVTPPLDLKGNLPNSGIIFINDKCEVKIDVSSGAYHVIKNENEDEIEVVKDANKSEYAIITFKGTNNIHAQTETITDVNDGNDIMWHLPEYESKIKNVAFVNEIDYLKAEAYWDISLEKNKTVFAWLNKSGETYDLYIGSYGIIKPTNLDYMFTRLTALTNITFDNLDTSNVVTMKNTFSGSTSLKKLDLTSFDASNITALSSSFSYMTSLEEFIIGPKFKAPKLTNMSQSFRQDPLVKLDLSYMESKNKNISYAFQGCQNLVELDISNMDVSALNSTSGAFNGDRKLQSVYIKGEWPGAKDGKEYLTSVPNGEAIFKNK